MSSAPPSLEAVFRQTLILSAKAVRADIDPAVDHPEAQKLFTFLADGLQNPLLRAAEPGDLRMLASPHGSLDPGTRLQASHGVEGIALLTWSLQMADFPRHDVKAGTYEATQLVGLLQQDATVFLREAALRTTETLCACRNFYDALHRRLRKPDAVKLAATVKPEWLDLLQVEAGALLLRGDLSYQKRPVYEASPEVVTAFAAAVEERLRAATWLLGGEPLYSKVAVES
jgi:hypothetical protein